MARTRVELAADRAARLIRRRLAEDVDRLCSDAGVSHAALARAAGVPQSFLSRIFDGTARPSIETYARLTKSLNADLSARIYPNSGPSIRDRHQARILEEVLRATSSSWKRFTEVAVRRPARGWIDLVLRGDHQRVVVACEIESTLRRIEQLIRWSTEKAESLPSSSEWPTLDGSWTVSRLLIVRWTRTNRAVAREFARQLRLAFPADPGDARESLTGNERWPGAALLWAQEVDGAYRLVDGR